MRPTKQKKNVGPLQVRLANECNDPLTQMLGDEEGVEFKSGDLSVSISRCWAREASDDDKEFIFHLTEKNMKEMYEKSNWGWNESQKRKELTGKTSQYLVAKNDSDGQMVGFVHYRFDMDAQIPVLYCYEIQLTEAVQRRGLGAHLMHILYKLAERFKMKKVILTVFKHNTQALNFYEKKLKFRRDATAPVDDQKDYTVLSKKVER